MNLTKSLYKIAIKQLKSKDITYNYYLKSRIKKNILLNKNLEGSLKNYAIDRLISEIKNIEKLHNSNIIK